ncbi:MAG: hypothetical protein H6959_01315 [Chromatiaceae bacterium]|nr:hypothetical protein [Gammaproteobacteria bacterium]MCP5300994.1 hypothetical protein [Chromatiaceae bacterium]MCP5421533.1 hypothetical protein [Chromatiaceae bacterium]
MACLIPIVVAGTPDLHATEARAGEGPPTTASRFKVDSARETWRLSALQDYQYDVTIACFCAVAGRFRVTVRNGIVDRVAAHQPGATRSPLPVPGDFKSVDQMFEMIDRLMGSRPDRVALRLDRSLGFPALFSIDPRYGVADDELTIEIHSLTSLTAD